jgi:site-specific DNA recombinase
MGATPYVEIAAQGSLACSCACRQYAIESGEGRTRSDRTTAWHQQQAEQGRVSGGGTKAYGFKEDRIRHEPSEVRVVRWAAKRALAGDSLRSIVSRLNERGTPTVTGKQWKVTVMRRVLTAPRTAGLREHNGANYPAEWRPILDEATWAELCSKLLGRPGSGAGRRYLLTGGLAACRLCGANLIAWPKADGRRCYVCATDQGGCGKIRVLSAPLEEHVAELAAAEHERRNLGATLPQRSPAEDVRSRLAADESALEQLARDRYVTRAITRLRAQGGEGPLVRRIAEAQQELDRLASGTRFSHVWSADELPPAPWEVPPGTDPDPEDLTSWREWIARVVERVVVGPALQGRNFYDPDQVEVMLAD